MIFQKNIIFLLFKRHQTPIFGLIKWNSDAAFAYSFLGIVLGISGKIPPKTRNEFVVASFCSEISPLASYPFHEKWKDGVWNQGIFRILFCVLLTSYVEFIPTLRSSRAYVSVRPSVSLSVCPVIFWRSFARPIIARSACGRRPWVQIPWVAV